MSIPQELIQQATMINLYEYLTLKGEPFKQEGTHYRHKLHDSLIIKNNVYYWNSQNEHGNAINWVMRQYGLSFQDAITELTGYIERIGDKGRANETCASFKPSSDFGGVVHAPDERRVIAYLTKTRKISLRTVTHLIKRGLLFQDDKNNAVFPFIDETGRIVGAEVEGTLSQVRFKGLKTGSDHRYGYSVPMSDKPTRYALYFESAVDLLSFIDIEYAQGKSLNGCVLISLAGLKLHTLKHTLQVLSEGVQCVVCVDNDIAGANFTATLKTQIRGVLEHSPNKQYKDWNEQLQVEKQI